MMMPLSLAKVIPSTDEWDLWLSNSRKTGAAIDGRTFALKCSRNETKSVFCIHPDLLAVPFLSQWSGSQEMVLEIHPNYLKNGLYKICKY